MPRTSRRIPPTDSTEGRGWTAEVDGTDAVIALSGDWIGRASGVEPGAVQRISIPAPAPSPSTVASWVGGTAP